MVESYCEVPPTLTAGAVPVISLKLLSRFFENTLGWDLLPAKFGKKENSMENDWRLLGTGSVSLGPEGTDMVFCWHRPNWNSSVSWKSEDGLRNMMRYEAKRTKTADSKCHGEPNLLPIYIIPGMAPIPKDGGP